MNKIFGKPTLHTASRISQTNLLNPDHSRTSTRMSSYTQVEPNKFNTIKRSLSNGLKWLTPHKWADELYRAYQQGNGSGLTPAHAGVSGQHLMESVKEEGLMPQVFMMGTTSTLHQHGIPSHIVLPEGVNRIPSSLVFPPEFNRDSEVHRQMIQHFGIHDAKSPERAIEIEKKLRKEIFNIAGYAGSNGLFTDYKWARVVKAISEEHLVFEAEGSKKVGFLEFNDVLKIQIKGTETKPGLFYAVWSQVEPSRRANDSFGEWIISRDGTQVVLIHRIFADIKKIPNMVTEQTLKNGVPNTLSTIWRRALQ